MADARLLLVSEAAGAQLRFGLTVDALAQTDTAVTVTFSNGETGTYDLVIGADGIRSRVRQLLFGDAFQPIFTGHGVWRFTTSRPVSSMDSRMVSVSSGEVVRGSTTVQLIPSFSSWSATWLENPTMRPNATIVTSSPGRRIHSRQPS